MRRSSSGSSRPESGSRSPEGAARHLTPDPDLALLEARLKVTFRDRSLLQAALTHRSHLSVLRGGRDNERLEFLGDAVLELAVSHLLYRMADQKDEGGLTQLRSLLVRQDALAKIARRLGLAEFLMLGYGEREAGGASKPSLNANCFEAVVGAIYLDQSFDAAFRFCKRIFYGRIRTVLKKAHTKDPKSLLQEVSLSKYNALPRYVMVKETGSDHNRRFHIKVVLKSQLEFLGAGKSKKAAEQQAAAAALKQLNSESSS
ncbi:MAG: ribonuclease III [Candidatus Wallbacteria bacterium]|nr:ribonuclease III [Candidatus Wallbacteria bacterium]